MAKTKFKSGEALPLQKLSDYYSSPRLLDKDERVSGLYAWLALLAAVAAYDAYAIKTKKAETLTRFFWSFPRYPDQTGIRTAGSGERWLASNVGVKYMPRGRNYTYFDDCFIPAGQIPRYPYQKAIIGNRVWPMDIQIRMGVLNSTKGNDQNVG